ncbi:MAG TPA: hypothetical protein VGM60_22675 [Pseudonocardia sp.]|jgi:hypothetical protein|uniref:hypothetical protein n=1 Tax=Pseudonocardia sp. TaxID=60912 RepID=UPI002F40D98D
MDTVQVLIIIVIVLLIALGAVGALLYRRKRSERLQRHFGDEYTGLVAETGDRKAAETTLMDREQRRDKLDIRDLSAEEHDRFRGSWDTIQQSFVDAPARALNGADRLVIEIMRRRGYPVDDFARRTEDISVDHPGVVRDYRAARATRNASASSTGEADTERQRKALTAYRSLVEALLDSGAGQPSGTPPPARNTPGSKASGAKATGAKATGSKATRHPR